MEKNLTIKANPIEWHKYTMGSWYDYEADMQRPYYWFGIKIRSKFCLESNFNGKIFDEGQFETLEDAKQAAQKILTEHVLIQFANLLKISKLETINKPYKLIHPRDAIKEEMQARKWSLEWPIGAISCVLDIPTYIAGELFDDNPDISIEAAEKLGKLFGQSPEYWMKLYKIYNERKDEDTEIAECAKKAADDLEAENAIKEDAKRYDEMIIQNYLLKNIEMNVEKKTGELKEKLLDHMDYVQKIHDSIRDSDVRDVQVTKAKVNEIDKKIKKLEKYTLDLADKLNCEIKTRMGKK